MQKCVEKELENTGQLNQLKVAILYDVIQFQSRYFKDIYNQTIICLNYVFQKYVEEELEYIGQLIQLKVAIMLYDVI